MNRRYWLAAIAALAIGGAAAIGVSVRQQDVPPARPQPNRPTLLLVTSLPLIFGESFGVDRVGSPALGRLEQRYQVHAVGVADAASLNGHRLLLMAHPRAQPAEVLVELDQWVRGGGQLLLLADPRLQWPSERPLGDRLRPPPAFADTGLLHHWNLALSGPDPDGPATRLGGDRQVLTSAPGQLSAGQGCTTEADGFIARCAIGKGRVTVIADADFLNVEGAGALDGPTQHNLDLLVAELVRLETR